METIKKKLKEARARQRELRKEIDKLRQIMWNAGENPDEPEIDLTIRNKHFYIQWKNGQSFTEIARKYNLSPATVSGICHMIETTLDRKGTRYNKYKDLLKYK